MLQVVRHSDVGAFLARAEPWLLRSETKYGLQLGIAHQVASDPSPYRTPIYWATVEDRSAAEPVIGCVFRTPPYQVGVTELPAEIVPALVANLRELYPTVPGVAGPEPTATAFANLWTAPYGGEWTVLHRQRLHSLSAVKFPSSPAPGMLRLALDPDVPVARAWVAGFIKDTGVRHVSADSGERLIRNRRLYFWMDGQPRCMLGAVRDTPSSTGIGAVYTPPQFRNRGYASVAVATLSQRLLDSGRRSCFLYTDLANPASNLVYGRVGYEPVHDVIDIAIA